PSSPIASPLPIRPLPPQIILSGPLSIDYISMAHQLLSAPSSVNPRPAHDSNGRARASSGNSATTSDARPKRANKANVTPQDAVEFCVARFLRSFQALCVTARLYQKN